MGIQLKQLFTQSWAGLFSVTKYFLLSLGHPLFFFVYRQLHFLILGRLVGRVGKKKNWKKITRSLRVKNKMYKILWKMFMFLFLFFSMLLLCSFFRLKELFQVKNDVTTSLLFFFWNCQKFGWVGRTTVKREKKRGWPYDDMTYDLWDLSNSLI